MSKKKQNFENNNSKLKWTIAKKLSMAFAGIMIIMLILGIVSYSSIKRIKDVEHEKEELSNLSKKLAEPSKYKI